MKDSSKQRIQNQFGAFCVKVLKNEVRQAISKRRSGILKELREYLEKEGFEWPET